MTITPQVDAMPGMTPLGFTPQADTQVKPTAAYLRFQTDYQPEQCVSEDASRLVLLNVWLDEKEGKFVATDGSMLCVVPLMIDNEAGIKLEGFYSPKQLEKARKLGKKNGVAELIITEDKITYSDGSSEPRLKNDDFGTYPQYKQVLPATDRAENFKVSFNVFKLIELAKALGANPKNPSVILTFDDANSPIIVKASSEANGILMPMRFK